MRFTHLENFHPTFKGQKSHGCPLRGSAIHQRVFLVNCFYRCVDRKVFLATWKDIPAANEVQNQISDVSFSSGRNGYQRGTQQFSR